jgi:hypothetical protein
MQVFAKYTQVVTLQKLLVYASDASFCEVYSSSNATKTLRRR